MGHLPEKKLQDRSFYFNESAPIKDQIQSAGLSVEKVITYDRTIMADNILKEIGPKNLKRKVCEENQISKKWNS